MRAKLNSRAVAALVPKAQAYDCRDTDLKGFLLRVQPSGKKTWFLQYRRPNGQQTRVKLGSYPGLKPDGARSLALERASEAAKGIDLVGRKRTERAERIRARQQTLRAFMEHRYEPWAHSHLKSAKFQIARIRSDFKDWLDRPMSELSPFHVEGLRLTWKKEGMKPSSINRDIQRIQSVLSRAVEWGVVARHPLAGLKPLKVDKTGRVRFLTPVEEDRLRAALKSREHKLRLARSSFNVWRRARGFKALPERHGDLLDHVRPMVLLALNTGLRRGELLGLLWKDVNLPAKLLTVQANTSKSGNTRRVPLNAEAASTVEAWRSRQSDSSLEAFVFPGRNGERMARIDTAWRAVIAAAGLTDFRLHDCRHHFASRLVQNGVDLYTVKALLGHGEIAMTERYSHLAPDNLRAAVEKVAV